MVNDIEWADSVVAKDRIAVCPFLNYQPNSIIVSH
jgi:hypothetical protein